VGGLYPLTGSLRSECENDQHKRIYGVSKSFIWQCPGGMMPYVVGFFLSYMDKFISYDIMFRIILFLGSVPSSIVLILSFNSHENESYLTNKCSNPFNIALKQKKYWYILIGTGFSWLFYDILFYGLTFNIPEILSNIFGKPDLNDICWQTFFISFIGLLASIHALNIINNYGCKNLQMFNFFLFFVTCLIYFIFEICDSNSKWLHFTFTTILFFLLNWGINLTTYVIPSEIFPIKTKGIFFGITAAMGKIGALIGTFSYNLPNEDHKWIFYLCSSIIVLVWLLHLSLLRMLNVIEKIKKMI